jgi:hypothetical protein
VAVIALGRLRKQRVEAFDALRGTIEKSVHGGGLLLLPALSLLFLLGLVEYRPKTDSLEYVGPNEAV